MSEKVTVTSLGISPIKSCEFLAVDEEGDGIEVTPYGLEWDRICCVIGPSKSGEGTVVYTQREYPKMALVSQEIHEQGLSVSAPGMRNIFIQTGFSHDDSRLRTATMQRGEVTVIGQALYEGASEWFAEYLDVEGVEILEFRDDIARYVSDSYIREGASNRLRYADGSAISLGTQASRLLIDQTLLAAQENVISPERWRANIETEGSQIDDELFWDQISIGGLRAFVPSVSKRCEIPDIDPETGEIGKQVRVALSKARKGIRADGQTGTFTDLNLNPAAVNPDQAIIVRVGDQLNVLGRRETPHVAYNPISKTQSWGEE